MRDGLNPTRLSLPRDGEWGSLVDYLVARFPDDEARLREKVAAGEVVDELGRPYLPGSPYAAGGLAFLYRDPPVEARVPFDVEILHHDDDLVVVDKPHFLSVTPRGAWVSETVLVRLRRALDLPELSPAHRLDRVTAGVLVFTARREVRRAYQEMFSDRTVHKTYEAIAPVAQGLALPATVSSRIQKQHGVLQAYEEPGDANAHTLVELLGPAARPGLGHYRLTPTTGRTHQLRVHLAALGIPIVNDKLYPDLTDVAGDDYSDPLQLLAREIAFNDPLTGARRTFTSRRRLALGL